MQHSALMLAALLTMDEGRPADSMATLAGTYTFYGNSPAPLLRLVLTAEGRFTVSSQNIGVIEENRGRAEFREGHLILTPERPHADLKARGFSTKFTPIEGIVLVPEGREREVCNLVNLGLPAHNLRWSTYLRESGVPAGVPNIGAPRLPPEWAPMLLKAPIEGRVVEVLAADRARIDFGSDRGAMTGLVVWGDLTIGSAIGKGPWACTVVEVSPTESVITINPPIYPALHFEVGKRVRTRHILADFNPMTRRFESKPALKP
jgi:hypothetical protein